MIYRLYMAFAAALTAHIGEYFSTGVFVCCLLISCWGE